ncbi:MAG TPA: DNA methyltransferase [Rhodanobacter sp.]|nr:DNA methyltransferase [Rhodanobacter sp.]
MPLSWNEIKDRALKFSREWAGETSEDAEAKSFWDGFFEVFGVSRRRVANFERKVKKLDGKDGYIDLLWKGVLLVEHKSRGKDLDRAHTQARDYFHGLTDAELPKYLLVCDFARFRLYDLEGDAAPVEFALKDLQKHVRQFGFIAGYQARSFKEEDPVNVLAAERMGKLHDALKAAGYDGHALEVLLVRLLFCLFADDTGIFPRHTFHELLSQRTSIDGADIGQWLAQLFQVLDTAPARRQKTLDAQLAEFPYVNGKLFAEPLPLAAFDANMRALLLQASALDWSRISPAIFGSMFQSVMDSKARRNLGAHYTSEKNILKLIGPLFLDELSAELERIGHHEGKLKSFHVKLASLRFLDPACGCGNFLVIAYRELRLLEIEVLQRLYARQGSVLHGVADHVAIDVDQFYGIEIEEFPAQIAQVALWLMDHQMNLRVAEQFGEYFARLPLTKAATIVHGNALRIDWKDVVKPEELSYILGNPPFMGHHLQTAEQKADMLASIGDSKGVGVLDFVTAWYAKAAEMITGTSIPVAFVSTNSITQGEQVGILWRAITKHRELSINFAHRTFRWSNEARGKAAVYCVIIGFSEKTASTKVIFEYDSVGGDPHPVSAKFINAYLVDAPWVLLENRSKNPFGKPEMMYGSKPTDDGNFLFTDAEKDAFLDAEPRAEKFIKPFVSAHEYLHGERRWVLWLVDADPADVRALPLVQQRVQSVAAFRKASKAASTRSYPYPALFRQVTQPASDYVLIPGHTSENRAFIPFGFFNKDTIVGNSCFSLPTTSLCDFGLIQSTMHMAWVRYTCGRLESRYRYSKDIVYNNFPWPDLPDTPSTVRTERSRPQDGEVEVSPPHPSTSAAAAAYAQGEREGRDVPSERCGKLRAAIETAAQAVLDARAKFPDAALADLYDPLSMPPALVKAHQALDRAVDAAYVAAEKAAGRKPPKLGTDAERVAFLFERYQQLTSLLPAVKTKPARRKRMALESTTPKDGDATC